MTEYIARQRESLDMLEGTMLTFLHSCAHLFGLQRLESTIAILQIFNSSDRGRFLLNSS